MARIGVIRGDVSPLQIDDLEQVSRHNPSTEPSGQERVVRRPTVAEVEAALADATTGAGAAIEGGTITINLVVGAGNDAIRLRTAAGDAFVTYLIAQTTYTTLADLIVAINVAINGSGITAATNRAGDGIILESNTKGVNSYVESDTVANGSEANTDLAITDGEVRDMPSAAAFITDTLPVGGPLDVSAATVEAVGAGTNANALAPIPVARGTTEGVADAVAPQFFETAVFIESFQVGTISGFLNANFNPDSRRVPALADGAAIEVVDDDGSTTFTAALPSISSATLDSPGAGDVTIAGANMGSAGDPNSETQETVVKFSGTGTPRGGDLVIPQALIVSNGGTVSATSIVVPAVLNPDGFVTTDTSVQVRYRSLATGVEALA